MTILETQPLLEVHPPPDAVEDVPEPDADVLVEPPPELVELLAGGVRNRRVAARGGSAGIGHVDVERADGAGVGQDGSCRRPLLAQVLVVAEIRCSDRG